MFGATFIIRWRLFIKAPMNYFKTMITLVVLIAAGKNYSQHAILLYSGDTLNVKVIEITEKKTTYKLLNYFDGPSIVISNSKIDQIVYPNGEVISFDDDSALGKENFVIKKNSIEIVVSEVLMGRIGFGYNRHLGNLFNLRISGAFSVSQDHLFNPYFLIKHYASLDGQYFPLGHKRVSFYTGLRATLGQRQYYDYYSYYSGNGYPISTTINKLRNYGTFQIQNGIQVNIGQNFNINAMWATGLLLCEEERDNKSPINQGYISIGFKF